MMDLISVIWTNGLSFIIILSVIVFVHEMGHYLIARYNGVRVEVFSIGFGPEIFGWDDRAGTRWKIGLLPLGGYVKMFGDANEASAPGGDLVEMTPEERAVSFHHKRLGQRTAVVFGGPLANFLLAIVILSVMFATVGQRITPAEISMIKPGSPVLRIDGAAIERFEDLQNIARENAGVPLAMVILRDGVEIELTVTPALVEQTDRFGNIHRLGQIGVGRSGVTFVRHGPLYSIWAATVETYSLTAMTLRALGEMIVGVRTADELGGPIRIAQISGQVAEDGLVAVLWFTSLLSINLGLINLFPIPMLDGGHLLFYAFEAIRGKPLGERAQEYGFRIGLAVVLSLFVFVTWNDFVRLEVVDLVVGLFS